MIYSRSNAGYEMEYLAQPPLQSWSLKSWSTCGYPGLHHMLAYPNTLGTLATHEVRFPRDHLFPTFCLTQRKQAPCIVDRTTGILAEQNCKFESRQPAVASTCHAFRSAYPDRPVGNAGFPNSPGALVCGFCWPRRLISHRNLTEQSFRSQLGLPTRPGTVID